MYGTSIYHNFYEVFIKKNIGQIFFIDT